MEPSLRANRARIRATRWLAMTLKYNCAISQRQAPEFCMNSSPNRGRRECRTLGASAAACAVVESTRVSHNGHAGNVRHSPRDGFTAYSALSLVTGLSCHHRLADTSATLDTSVGVPGPHGFAVRGTALSSLAPPASIASHPYVRDVAQRPSKGLDGERYIADLGWRYSWIFFSDGVDSNLLICPSGRKSARQESDDAHEVDILDYYRG